jgi:hypothetical protein
MNLLSKLQIADKFIAYRFLRLKKSSSSYTSLDLMINTISISFIFSTTSIKSFSRLLLIRLFFVLALASDHCTNLFLSRHKISITRLIQSKTCSFETSQKIAVTKNPLTLSSWSSRYKTYLSWFITEVCKIVNWFWKTASFFIRSTTRLRKWRLIRT